MRTGIQGVVLSLLLCGLLPAACAQRIITDETPAPPARHSTPPPAAPKLAHSAAPQPAHAHAPRLLDKDDGLSVLAASLTSHIRHTSGDDCSHLVHDIYERAGFSYPYANSWQLYDGVDRFHRVWRTQPGDLVVWQGHVGILVNPNKHLFFSELTSTGQDIASYDAPYWRERGHPRFFRYLKPEEEVGQTELAKVRPERTPHRQVRLHPPASATRTATAGDDETAGDGEVAGDAEAQSGPSPAALDPPTRDPEPSRDTEASMEPATEPAPAPPLPQVRSLHPKSGQVREAILLAFQQAADSNASISRPWAQLIVFDRLTVRKLHLKGNRGWVEVDVHQVGSFAGGRTDLKRRTLRSVWSLHRRDRHTWEVDTPQDSIYLPREQAAPVLAHQLAALTGGEGHAGPKPEKASLARLLSMLLGS